MHPYPLIDRRVLYGIQNYSDGYVSALAETELDQASECWARLVVRLLEKTGYPLTPRHRGQILACRDLGLL